MSDGPRPSVPRFRTVVNPYRNVLSRFSAGEALRWRLELTTVSVLINQMNVNVDQARKARRGR